MSGKKFSLPPLSPLIGSGIFNYLRVTGKGKIRRHYQIKYILTGLIIIILSPFRWFEQWYFRKISKTRIRQPLFIVGHWRSGTTLLHNLLCESPEAGFVTTYQTVFTNYLASSGLLRPFMHWIMPHKRPGDNVELNVDYPQEEEFALSNMSTASYYHFFYFPKRREEYFRRFVHFEKKDLPVWRKAYDLLLRKAAAHMPGISYLVVKNPVNTGRVNVLKEMYPDARFIHIYRNPYTVFLSTRKFFRELMPTLWFHEITDEEIENLILDQYVELMDMYYGKETDRSGIVDIRFEDFEEDPVGTLEHVWKELGMGGVDQVKPHFIRYAESQKGYRKNKYSISRREVELIQSRWGTYLRRWNYDLPENIQVVG